MCRRIPSWKFREWKFFEELEPFPAQRADWNTAYIVQAFMRDGKQLSEFMLPFGDYVTAPAVIQPIAYQEMVIDAWIGLTNAVHAPQESHGR